MIHTVHSRSFKQFQVGCRYFLWRLGSTRLDHAPRRSLRRRKQRRKQRRSPRQSQRLPRRQSQRHQPWRMETISKRKLKPLASRSMRKFLMSLKFWHVMTFITSRDHWNLVALRHHETYCVCIRLYKCNAQRGERAVTSCESSWDKATRSERRRMRSRPQAWAAKSVTRILRLPAVVLTSRGKCLGSRMIELHTSWKRHSAKSYHQKKHYIYIHILIYIYTSTNDNARKSIRLNR